MLKNDKYKYLTVNHKYNFHHKHNFANQESKAHIQNIKRI